MHDQKLTKYQIVERGQRIYDEQLRPQMERDHLGQFLVVDVLSGDFELAEEDIDASKRMLDRRPDALLCGIRIGEAAAYRFGAVRCV